MVFFGVRIVFRVVVEDFSVIGVLGFVLLVVTVILYLGKLFENFEFFIGGYKGVDGI